ncbi:hypothetical protein [Paraburkholderia humisilvae]|uniref:Uncharacterized protein n=1 Tax=Paraburkholderia humisilvae TaxID=627669 RepID=A0A6J5F3I9_9BURK|nr:hypothetical protein [Paraburkholderia humisilvae]CAB3773419.1 hypothetical protein LMG29542_07237 [Paraburkholderia humisilvae]
MNALSLSESTPGIANGRSGIVAAEPSQAAWSRKDTRWTPFSYCSGILILDHVSPYLDVTVREQLEALATFDRLDWE